MLVGLVSDTHGNVAALERALGLFQRAQVERVFFLGGRAADVDAALARRAGGSRGGAVPASDAEFLDAVRGALERQAGAAGVDPLADRIVRVASRACPEYESGKVPRKQIDLLEGRVCCLVHDKADLTRDDIANASMVFHGNSAVAALVQIGPRCFVTPGHLREPPPAGRPPTFALAEVTPREVVLTVFSDACEELRQERAVAAPAGKLSVK